LKAAIYFSKKGCKRGHNSARYVSTGDCVVCAREAATRRYAEKKIEIVALRKKNYDPKKALAQSQKWQLANKEKVIASRKRYYRKHRTRLLAQNKAAHHKNPQLKMTRKRNYLARKRAAAGKHSATDIAIIFKLQRGHCAYCRLPIARKYHVDHIEPLARGGTNWPRNLQLLCATCNTSKQATDPIDFAQRKGMLV
jgi:5-methylcytosine-specific restriction endonuclease McrA